MDPDFPEIDSRLLELVIEWEQALESGQPKLPEDLCIGCLDLLTPLRQCIEQLRSFDRDFVGSRLDEMYGTGMSPFSLAGYEILEEIGRGGMGIVYKARQRSLGRLVAIKMINGGPWGNATLIARLRSEAAALGRLNHEHVIQVYDVIDQNGMVCLILEYIDGTNFARRDAGMVIDPRTAAQIAHTVAITMGDIHRMGLLHRDLKPANLLQDKRGMVKIGDFGLAKHYSAESSASLTGDVVGTPSYMAPEQATGKSSEMGAWTDVYAIGATLYDFLTGRPPFAGATLLGTLAQVQQNDPVPPRLLVPQIPRDLETICFKCLEKEPRKRYASAESLAADLENFLAGRPVTARPLTPVGRAWRWSKRHPERALVLVGLMLIVLLGPWYATRLSDARRETELKTKMLVAEREKGRAQELNLLGARIREQTLNRPKGWINQTLIDLQQASGKTSDDETRRMLRNEAVRVLCAPQLEFVRTVIDDFDAYSLSYSPDGRYLAIGCNVSIDGRGTIALFDADTRQEVRRLTFEPSPELGGRKNSKEGVRSLQFTPDGKQLFVGTRGGMIQRWSLDTFELEQSWQAHHDYVLSIGLLPEYGVLASISEDCRLKFWNWTGGQIQNDELLTLGCGESIVVRGKQIYLHADFELWEFDFQPESKTFVRGWRKNLPGSQLALLPDQRTLLSLTTDLATIDLFSGQVQRRWSDPHRSTVHTGEVHSVGVSSNGRWTFSSAQDGLKLWDFLSREKVGTLPNAANCRVSGGFHPHREELAVSREGRVEIWKIAGTSVWDSALHESYPVKFMDLSADGRMLAGEIDFPSKSEVDPENYVRIVDVERLVRRPDRVHYPALPDPLAVSKRGHFIVFTQGLDTTFQLRDLEDNQAVPLILPVLLRAGKPVFATNEERVWYTGLARAKDAGVLIAVNTRDGLEEFRWVNERSERERQRSSFLSLAVGEDVVAASSIDGTVRLFNPADGKLLREIPVPEVIVDKLCLSADGKWILCGTRSGHIFSLATADGRTGFRALVHDEPVTALCASDVGLIASASSDGTVILWQLDEGTLRELFRLGPLSRSVTDAVLSRDGTLLAILVEDESGIRLLRLRALRQRLAELGLDWP